MDLGTFICIALMVVGLGVVFATGSAVGILLFVVGIAIPALT